MKEAGLRLTPEQMRTPLGTKSQSIFMFITIAVLFLGAMIAASLSDKLEPSPAQARPAIAQPAQATPATVVDRLDQILVHFPHTSVRSVYFGTHGTWLNGELKDCVTTHTDHDWLGCDGNTYSTGEGRKFEVRFDMNPDLSTDNFQDWQCSKHDDGISCKAVK